MHKSEYSSIDSTNGNVSWKGPLSVEKVIIRECRPVRMLICQVMKKVM